MRTQTFSFLKRRRECINAVERQFNAGAEGEVDFKVSYLVIK
jgi:hypothetical protein